MGVLVYLLQDTERIIIPYLNKEETLEGLLNDGYDLHLTLKFCYYDLMWKKKKRRYSRLVILDSKNDTTKKIKKILSEKHPGYEKRSKDEKMFNQACEKISFYLLDGNIKKARSVLKRIPFVPIRLSEQEIDNIIQKYKK